MTIHVGVARMAVSANCAETIVTFALGSCLGIAVYDPVAKVGGILHAMLPFSSLDPQKAERNAAMFVDTGVPALFRACYRLGARKDRMKVWVAGGASAMDAADTFQIGKRNIAALRKLLRRNGVALSGSDVGGSAARTLALRLSDGGVTVTSSGATVEISQKPVPATNLLSTLVLPTFTGAAP